MLCLLFKQKTAYELRISDWGSDVCSSDLRRFCPGARLGIGEAFRRLLGIGTAAAAIKRTGIGAALHRPCSAQTRARIGDGCGRGRTRRRGFGRLGFALIRNSPAGRSEEHTSELQSLMRISYAVFCLKKKKTNHNRI